MTESDGGGNGGGNGGGATTLKRRSADRGRRTLPHGLDVVIIDPRVITAHAAGGVMARLGISHTLVGTAEQLGAMLAAGRRFDIAFVDAAGAAASVAAGAGPVATMKLWQAVSHSGHKTYIVGYDCVNVTAQLPTHCVALHCITFSSPLFVVA